METPRHLPHRRRGLAGDVEVAGPQRDDAPFDEGAAAQRVRSGRATRGPTPGGWPPPRGRRADDGRDRGRSRSRAAPPGSASAAAVSSAAIAAGYSPSRARSSPIRSWACSGAGIAEGDGRRQVVDRFAIGEDRLGQDRPPRGRPRPPRPAGPPRVRAPAISANRVRSSRPPRPTRSAAPPPSVDGGGDGAPGSSIRRPRRASGRGRSRTGPMARPDPAPRGRSRGASAPRRRRWSPPRTDRSLSRTVARSNERPMTAAADRTWAAVSPTDAIRSRSSAWTPRGIASAGRLTAGQGGDDVERQSLRVGGERVDQGVVDLAARPRRADDRPDVVALEPTEDEARRARDAGEVRQRSLRRRRSGPRAARPAAAPAIDPRGVGPGTPGLRGSSRRRGAGRRPRPARDRARTRAPTSDVARSRRGAGPSRRPRRGRPSGRAPAARSDGGQVDQAADLERGRSRRGSPGASAPPGVGETGAEELGDRAVGDGGLARIAAGGEDDPAVGADRRRDRLAQPGLADPGLALEQDEPTVRRRGPPGRADRRELRSPPDRAGSTRASRSTAAIGWPATAVGGRVRGRRLATAPRGSRRTGRSSRAVARRRARGRTTRRARGTAGSRRRGRPTGRAAR